MKRAAAVALLSLGAYCLYLISGQRPRDAAAIAASVFPATTAKQAAVREIEALIVNWPPASQRAARRMIRKYGLPDQAAARALTWNDNGPWKRSVVRREGGVGALESVAAYRLPHDRFEVLAELDGQLSAERGQDELAARSDDEALNFLAVNLADEVIWRKRAAAEARRFHADQAALARSGKGSPYTESLLFDKER